MHDAYSVTFRAETIARAREVGAKKAAKEKGVHWTTVYKWLRTRPAEVQPIIERVDLETGDRIIAARDRALAETMARIPTMGDIPLVKAMDVLDRSATLIEGRATSRVESTALNVNLNANGVGTCPTCGRTLVDQDRQAEAYRIVNAILDEFARPPDDVG